MNKRDSIPPLKTFDLADLLNKELPPETPEEAYRRGYRDAVIDLWADNIIARKFDEQISDFIDNELLEWAGGDTSKKVLPPEFNPKKKQREQLSEQ